MKKIAIRLPDVDVAMLGEMQRVNGVYRDLQGLLLVKFNRICTMPRPEGQASK